MKHYRVCDGKFVHVKDITNSEPAPSYIIRSECKKFIYCTSEIPKSLESGVCAFACDGTEITFINRVLSEGISPCHLCLSDNGTHLFVSNYMGGNVVVLPINDDGSLGRSCQSVSHQTPMHIDGALKMPNRNGAHAHQAVLLSDSRTLLVCDLGLDTVFSYRYDAHAVESQVLREDSRWHCRAGAGPRHLAVHPSGQFAYLLSEIDCTLVAVRLDKATGAIVPSESLEYHPLMRSGEEAGSMNAAEVLISEDGRFVYASNRDVRGGERDPVSAKLQPGGSTSCSISVFAVGADGASLTFVQQVHSRGRHPRGMVLAKHAGEPALLVANKDEGYQSTMPGGNLVLFPLERETGRIMESLAVVTEDLGGDDGAGAIVEPTWILVL
jgi:6-phosphogluconolactonase